jgi:Mg-chelatase subunit ChlD
LADIARLNRRARATICTIQFGRGPRQRENFLVDLANQTGGQYVYIDTTQF